MSSGIGGGISGGAGRGRGGGGTHRKNSKKFGKNLNKLTKAPAAPPVPVISAGGGGGSSSSFRGSSSSRNGLLLLSTKSKSSCSKSGGSGLLASSGTPKTAHDALLLSAGAGGQGGGEAGKKTAPAPAWGMGEKKQAAPSPEKKAVQNSGEVEEKPELVLSRRSSMQRPKPLPRRSPVGEVVEKLENMDLKTADNTKKIFPDRRHVEKPIERLSSDVSQPKEKPVIIVTQPKEIPLIAATEPKEEPAIVAKQAPKKEEKVKDDQVEYMSKLAKERAEKLRLEEEARMTAQKERAAIRLRELEEKRLEERKKQLEEKKKEQQVKSQARKELSKPQVILEPLGKSKKDASNSTSLKPTSKNQPAEKNAGRKLYDPDRPYSSLVGGKATKTNVDNAKKQEERPRGNAKKFSSLAPGPAASHGKQSAMQSSIDNKKDDPPPPVQMVQLSKLDELDRGGRGGGQGGPRMLFDPTSGSMVAVSSREEPKSSMKKKQNKGPQKSPIKRSEEVGKIISRRPMDGVGANESGSDVKLLRGRQGKGSRKDEPTPFQPKNKKSLDNKGRSSGQHQTPRKRIPRTCGVLYKMDKSNYVNVDGCEPDNGYGAYRVPGGKVKNPGAHAKLLKQQEEQNTASQPTTNDVTPAAEGFSFRNDPGFQQHQTDFEAQQQRILEDAWATLVENEEPLVEEEETEQEGAEELPASRSGDDDYAAAMAIIPSAMGLNFDSVDDILLPSAVKGNSEEPIDLAKFALEAASSTSAANPFSPLGVSGAGLWGGGTHSARSASSYGDLGALTGWVATPFGETDTMGGTVSAGLNGNTSQSSKLHLWGGSSALDTTDDAGLGNSAIGSHVNSDASKD